MTTISIKWELNSNYDFFYVPRHIKTETDLLQTLLLRIFHVKVHIACFIVSEKKIARGHLTHFNYIENNNVISPIHFDIFLLFSMYIPVLYLYVHIFCCRSTCSDIRNVRWMKFSLLHLDKWTSRIFVFFWR